MPASLGCPQPSRPPLRASAHGRERAPYDLHFHADPASSLADAPPPAEPPPLPPPPSLTPPSCLRAAGYAGIAALHAGIAAGYVGTAALHAGMPADPAGTSAWLAAGRGGPAGVRAAELPQADGARARALGVTSEY